MRNLLIGLIVTVLLLVAVSYFLFSSGLGYRDARFDVGENASASLGLNDLNDPEKVVQCPALDGEIATVRECLYYEGVFRKLAIGAAALDVPDEIVRGETATVSFVVSRHPDISPLPELLGSEPSEQFQLKVGRRMAALLQGDGFTIEPTGLQHRDLFVGDGARWDWKVTAKRGPRHRLLLSAYVVVPSKEGKKENLLKTIERAIPVKITWGQWFDDFFADTEAWLTKGTNWLKALGAFFAAAVALWFMVFRKRNSTIS